MTAVHAPDTQTWSCLACGEDWPCVVRRDQLHAVWKETPVWIEQLMGAYLLDALAARPDMPHREMRERHLGWVRERYGLPIPV
jgi:hypothetical protein